MLASPCTSAAEAHASAIPGSGPTTVALSTANAGWPRRRIDDVRAAFVATRRRHRTVLQADHLHDLVLRVRIEDAHRPPRTRGGLLVSRRTDVPAGVDEMVDESPVTKACTRLPGRPALDEAGRVVATRNGPGVERAPGEVAQLAAGPQDMVEVARVATGSGEPVSIERDLGQRPIRGEGPIHLGKALCAHRHCPAGIDLARTDAGDRDRHRRVPDMLDMDEPVPADRGSRDSVQPSVHDLGGAPARIHDAYPATLTGSSSL